jgi:hypothetical protein
MSERDAFGREKGEDPLQAMGWSSGAPTPPVPATVAEPARAEPTPTEPPPSKPKPVSLFEESAAAAPPLPPTGPAVAWTAAPPATVRYRRRRRTRGVLVPLFIVGFIALVGIGGITSLVSIGTSGLDGGIVTTVPDDPAPNPPPVGLEPGSLFRPAALRAALAKLPDGDLQTLRVAPERIDANVVIDGRMHVVQVTSDGEVQDIPTPAKTPGEALKVNAAAPNRIVKKAARRERQDPSAVSYLVLLDMGWQLFFEDGTHYSANASGRTVEKVG